MYVDELEKEVVFAVENKLLEHLFNLGTGTDVTIKYLEKTIQKVVGHKGSILRDNSKPDGAPRKLLYVSKMNILDWNAKIDL